ncbi:MAG: O-antigen ligase family protein [Solirubrobacteraceae bacterium]|nr:O-antigen ligase family protein [Solirubrobacteraceae bacterium]
MGAAVPLIACSALAAGALVVRSDRARAWLLLASLVLAPVILAIHVRDSDQLATLRERPALAAAALAGGFALVVLLALLFRRIPTALAVAALVTLPLRLPLAVAGASANLLLGLYLVVAAGVLAWAAPRLRAPAVAGAGAGDGDGAGAGAGAGRRPGALEWALAVVLVLYAAQSAYSDGHDRALENVVFFYVPFAALYVLLSRLEWTARLQGIALGTLAGLAAALTAVGYVEYATRHILLNPKVIASNQVEEYFRVNSLFFDPNIFGRFLAIVLVLAMAWMLWRSRGRQVALAAPGAAFVFGGLLLTLSQSSFAALLAGLAVLAALRWSVRRTLAAVALALVVALAAIALGTDAFKGGKLANRATSGRAALVEGGLRLARERPLTGWGSGAFAREYRRAEAVSVERASSASHTIPITVLAEQGAGGLLAYLVLLGCALARLLRGARGAGPARAAIAAAFVALVVHTLLYAAFLEDPLAWALLAVGTALASAGAGRDTAGFEDERDVAGGRVGSEDERGVAGSVDSVDSEDARSTPAARREPAPRAGEPATESEGA